MQSNCILITLHCRMSAPITIVASLIISPLGYFTLHRPRDLRNQHYGLASRTPQFWNTSVKLRTDI